MANDVLDQQVSQFVVSFDEPLSTPGASSVLKPSNWQVISGGSSSTARSTSVKYGLNEAYTLGLESSPSNNYEAVLTLDGNPFATGNQALDNGTLHVHASATAVKDISATSSTAPTPACRERQLHAHFHGRRIRTPVARNHGQHHRSNHDAAHSVATDDSGDFVDVYTRTNEAMLNPDGTPLLDADRHPGDRHEHLRPLLHQPRAADHAAVQGTSKFSLVYGGNAVEEICV